MKLTVDRKLWSRGIENATFLEQSGRMTILGFLANKCGAKKQDILDKNVPENNLSFKWPRGLISKDNKCSKLCADIVLMNNSFSCLDPERETKLKELLKQIKVDVAFVG